MSLRIAKSKKPHTIGEELVLPCTKDIVRLMIGADAVKKLISLSISDKTVQRRIQEMSEDIKNQVVEQIKQPPIFVLQLDESTDVSSCAQLMIYVRYIHNSNFKDEFLFCQPLESHTRGIDVFGKVDTFFVQKGLDWRKVGAVCTNGAPSMLGSHSGFQTRVRQVVPDVITNHCMLHREALAAKTLPASLNVILLEVIKIVNFVKCSALNIRLFRNHCLEMDAAHIELLYHTEVRWLSKGNVLKHVLDLKEEIKEFLNLQKRAYWQGLFENNEWISKLCYLCDILERLNALNLSLQGKDSNIMDFIDKLSAFQAMLELWRIKIINGRITVFSHLSSFVEDCETSISESLQNDIATHLQSLKEEFSRYFPETTKSKFTLVRNPFLAKMDDCISDNHDAAQEEFIKLLNDSGAQELFLRVDLPSFWSSLLGSYPRVSDMALKLLMPFPSTYLCEAAFSSMLVIKNKARQYNFQNRRTRLPQDDR